MPVGSWGPCVTSDLLQNPSTKRLPATPGTVCVDAVLPRAAGRTARLQPLGRGGSEGLVWGSLEAAGHVRDPAMPLGWVGAPHCSESPRCTLQALPLRGTQMTGAPALRLGSRCRGLCTKSPGSHASGGVEWCPGLTTSTRGSKGADRSPAASRVTMAVRDGTGHDRASYRLCLRDPRKCLPRRERA